MKVIVDQYIQRSEECEEYKSYRENIRHPYRMIRKMLKKKVANSDFTLREGKYGF